MKTLRHKLNLLLRYMELGCTVKLPSGHRLVMAEGYDEPGFEVMSSTSIDGVRSPEQAMVMQIGSETTWMTLIQHAKSLTKDQAMNLSMAVGVEEDRQMRRDRNFSSFEK